MLQIEEVSIARASLLKAEIIEAQLVMQCNQTFLYTFDFLRLRCSNSMANELRVISNQLKHSGFNSLIRVDCLGQRDGIFRF